MHAWPVRVAAHTITPLTPKIASMTGITTCRSDGTVAMSASMAAPRPIATPIPSTIDPSTQST